MSYSKFEALRHRIEPHEEHLIQIYEQQTEFARFHNALVWQVSSIFIPFSFAGLSLPFAKEVQLWLVGLGSMFVLVMWSFLAEWHRWLWVHSFTAYESLKLSGLSLRPVGMHRGLQ